MMNSFSIGIVLLGDPKTWDWHDAFTPSSWSNWALVFVGFGAIGAALWTLFAIKEQTKISARQALSMRRQTTLLRRSVRVARLSAKLAKDSSDTLANIERAWVDLRLTKQGPAVYFWEITNYGRTVAHIKELTVFTTLTSTEQDAAPSTTETTYPRNKLMFPNLPWNAFILNLVQDLGEKTFQRVRRGEIKLAYRGVVRYASVAPNCESECLYYYNTASDYDCLVPVEAPEFNKRA